jgi:hypothetical protein
MACGKVAEDGVAASTMSSCRKNCSWRCKAKNCNQTCQSDRAHLGGGSGVKREAEGTLISQADMWIWGNENYDIYLHMSTIMAWLCPLKLKCWRPDCPGGCCEVRLMGGGWVSGHLHDHIRADIAGAAFYERVSWAPLAFLSPFLALCLLSCEDAP